MADQGTPANVGGNSDSGAAMSWTNSRSVSSAASDATVRASPASSVMSGESLASIIRPQQTAGAGQMQHEPRGDTVSHDSGISSMRRGQGQSLSQQHAHDGSRTQEWIDRHFQVFVVTPEGKKVTMEVTGEDTVASFQTSVSERTGVHLSQQYLVSHGGRTLTEGKLKDYQIVKHSTIYCQVRLRGGVSA